MYHLRMKGKHYEMGAKRGRIFKKNGIIFPLRLDDFQRGFSLKSRKILEEYFPEVCEEIRGVSDAAGVDYETMASWMTCMGCCMYNLEDNVPVETRGCTALAFTSGGGVYYARNNDLPPFLKKGSKSELYAPAGGSRFNITTSSFINGEEGVNEHGLAVAMTFVMTRLEDIRPGFSSCFTVRYLLEKAGSVSEAVKMLDKLPIASNFNILLADKSGEMLVAECTPDLKNIRLPVSFGHDRLICAANTFSSPEMAGFDASKGDNYRAAERFDTVMNSFFGHIDAAGGPVEAAQRLLRGEYGFMCQYDDPDFGTVWSSVFDLNSLIISRAEGDPRKTAFITDARLRDAVRKKA